MSLLTEDRWPGGDRAAAVEECKTTAGSDPELSAAMSELQLAAPVEQDGTVTIEAHGTLAGPPLLLTFTLDPTDDTWLIESIT